MTVTLTTATNAISGALTLSTGTSRVTAAHIHDGDIGAPMSLAAGASYGNLVNQPASVGTRVIPDNSADSVLFKRITGTTAGPRMPPSPAPLLPASTQSLIKVWIDMGAKNN